MKEEQLNNLEAYFDGELSPEEAACMDSQLQAQPELRQTLDTFKRVSACLAQLPKAKVPFDLSSRVLAQAGQVSASPFALADSSADLTFLSESVLTPGVGGESASFSAQKEDEARSNDDWQAPTWRQRISRAMLWPVLALIIALGFYVSNLQDSAQQVAITTEPTEIDISEFQNENSSNISDDSTSEDLFSDKIPFIQPSENVFPVGEEAVNPHSSEPAINTVPVGSGLPPVTPQNKILRTHSAPPVVLTTPPSVEAIQTDGPAENTAEAPAAPVVSNDDKIAPVNKDVKIAIQCKCDKQNFNAEKWYEFLERNGVSADKSQSPLAVGAWTFEATVQQRGAFMENVSSVTGVVSAESIILNSDSKTDPAEKCLTEIRLIPAEM